ncbi:putative ABC transporter solute-binding protein YclQ precursor [Oxobacter pfennigii]|uniref:Putative ABC transporter solute-binding protein YclQ n=1 Tax=Oxobacter pfennigii TaxID=36849 RepID=A0A0N8NTL9_9CLOT|nr:ABC transporter substrate-binding protein [Oxobacter pfennigii]KPU45200.1 putative ABC transporter solute-binding protein YclQ precursor [Oxobacter pfennigii]
MKKSIISFILTAMMALGALSLSGCNKAPETQAPEETPAETVTVTDSDGKEVTLNTNPTKVAIYDYSILDILYNGDFDKTGITQLIVPSKDSLPADLSFYKEAGDDKVISGGSLFYVDWDVLDLVQPELVITGGRAFGVGASGESLSKEEKEKYMTDTFARYPDASFMKLTTNASNSQLLKDIEHNITTLGQIFPSIKPELDAKLEKIKKDFADINAKAKSSGKKALFCMMVDQTTLSVFNPNSRFDMLYEDFGFTPVDDGAVAWTNQHGFDVRAEYVLEKNPDVIFLLDRSATVGTGAGAENFMNDPIIKQTQAAKNGDIYVLTGDAWYTMTGGITAAERMVEDINQYISKLN